jgi:hypothetical protein
MMRPRVCPKTLLAPLLAAVWLAVLPTCATTPAPLADDDSLLAVLSTARGREGESVLFSLSGPLEVRIDLTADSEVLKIARLAPGDYDAAVAAGPVTYSEKLRVPPQSVVLFPWRFDFENGGLRELPVAAADQERAAQLLLDHIGVQAWFDRRYEGFGDARPKTYLSGDRFPLELSTEPAGADISIDGQARGRSPLTVELAAGRYLVLAEKPGFQPVKKFVTMGAEPRAETITLEKTADKTAAAARDKFFVMTYPFVNLDDPRSNPYGTVFQVSLQALFAANRRLKTVPYSGQTEGLEPADYPDLRVAETAGAELAVAGEYQEKSGGIFVHALLYDVRSRRVKLGVIYTGKAGFDVFTTIDGLSREFARAADQSLPEPGQPVIEQEADAGNTFVEYEKELFKEHVIERYASRPNELGLSLALAGGVDPLAVGSFQGVPRMAPVFFINALRLSYERLVTPVFSFSNALTFSLGQNNGGDVTSLTWDFFLDAGPKLSFRNEKYDISIEAMLTLGFAPPLAIVKSGVSYDFGPFFYLGSRMGIGYRYYFQNRLSDRPVFLDLGLVLDLALFRFDFRGSSPVYEPFSMVLSVGGGFGL